MMNKTYRIANENGLVDFAVDIEIIEYKLKKYIKEGYSKYLLMIEVDSITGKEKILKKWKVG